MLKDSILKSEGLEFESFEATSELLLVAIKNKFDIKLLKTMINNTPNTCNLNWVNKDGLSALYLAVESKEIEIVKFLLESGASNIVRAEQKQSPLFLAVSEKMHEICRVLMAYFFATSFCKSVRFGFYYKKDLADMLLNSDLNLTPVLESDNKLTIDTAPIDQLLLINQFTNEHKKLFTQDRNGFLGA